MSSGECRGSALSRKIKAAFGASVQQTQGYADLLSVYATGTARPTARESESCLGADGLGLVL